MMAAARQAISVSVFSHSPFFLSLAPFVLHISTLRMHMQFTRPTPTSILPNLTSHPRQSHGWTDPAPSACLRSISTIIVIIQLCCTKPPSPHINTSQSLTTCSNGWVASTSKCTKPRSTSSSASICFCGDWGTRGMLVKLGLLDACIALHPTHPPLPAASPRHRAHLQGPWLVGGRCRPPPARVHLRTIRKGSSCRLLMGVH